MVSGRAIDNPEHDNPQVIRRKAMDLLARREHAVGELTRKLSSRAYASAVVSQVIRDLQNEGLLSDDRFTEAYVHYRAEAGYGPIRIQAELRERGVSEEIQSSYLDFNDPQWRHHVKQVRSKRFGSSLPTDFKERTRQARFLQYRGFTGDQMRHALGESEE